MSVLKQSFHCLSPTLAFTVNGCLFLHECLNSLKGPVLPPHLVACVACLPSVIVNGAVNPWHTYKSATKQKAAESHPDRHRKGHSVFLWVLAKFAHTNPSGSQNWLSKQEVPDPGKLQQVQQRPGCWKSSKKAWIDSVCFKNSLTLC